MDTTLQYSDTQHLLTLLQQMRLDLDLLIRSGQWLVWSAVTKSADAPMSTGWTFRTDFCQVLPGWLSVERLSAEEDMGEILARVRVEEDASGCFDRAKAAFDAGAAGYHNVFRVRLGNGEMSWIEENVSIMRLPSGNYHLVGVCIDATKRMLREERMRAMQAELVAQNEELHALRDTLEQEKHALAEANVRLKSLVTVDGLTEIKNHRAFQEQLEAEWNAAMRHGTPVALIMLDIDDFKRYNDTFGHPAGDEVLKTAGKLLEQLARGEDCVARYGGEEFVIILPQTDADGALILAERYREAFEQWSWPHRCVTASVGVAATRAEVSNAQELLNQADRALYRAKLSGRNRVCLFDSTLGSMTGRHVSGDQMAA